jgi:hypothetical protein
MHTSHKIIRIQNIRWLTKIVNHNHRRAIRQLVLQLSAIGLVVVTNEVIGGAVGITIAFFGLVYALYALSWWIRLFYEVRAMTPIPNDMPQVLESQPQPTKESIEVRR